MKQVIFLFFALLCLGCVFPLLGYQLGQGVTLIAPIETAQPSPSASGSDSLSALLDDTAPSSSGDTTGNAQGNTDAHDNSNAQDAADDATATQTLTPFLIYDEGSQTVLTVSVRDYLIGAVASELPMTWPDEALKAQAIACHSYVLYCKNNISSDNLDGAYISADPARRQGFMTDDVLQSYWGEDYATNYARLSALVDEVLDVVVLYEGKAAATSYFAISNTMTQSSEAVWGQALPYLISVESVADANAEGYLTTVVYTKDQVLSILESTFGLTADGIAPADYFGQASYTDAGYVAQMEVCGTNISGSTLRTAFSLRSSCFWVSYQPSDDTFSFLTAGYGHGVGLSQWGAYYRAQAGDDYAAILAHYFPSTTLGSAASLSLTM